MAIATLIPASASQAGGTGATVSRPQQKEHPPAGVEGIEGPTAILPEQPSLRPYKAKARTSARRDMVTLNFVNADIEGVVKAVSEISRKNFMLDPRVQGAINVVSAQPVPRDSVYEIFLSALRLHGFAVVEDEGIIRIVPESDAKLYRSTTIGPEDSRHRSGDRIQTQVFALQYESALQMVPVLRPLIAPNNSITANPGSNTLIITDYASNLQRLEKIIAAADQPGGTAPVSIPLHHASAIDVAQTVNRLFADSTQNQGDVVPGTTLRITVVADARSNTLLARSADRAALTRLRELVTILDTPTSAGGNMHVVFLKNADAVKLAETLRAIYHNIPPPASSPASQGQPAAASGASSFGTPTGNLLAGSSPAGTMSPATSLTPAPMQTQTALTATAGIIQADAATNSIIITAPDAIYNNLRAVIEKLDVRRVQVYIEALIAEITAERATEFGIQWQNLSNVAQGGTRVFGGTSFNAEPGGGNILSTAQNPIANAASGLTIGIMQGLVTAIPGIGPVINIHTLVRALETDTNANILSTPTLLTLNNEEARIIIGQNVPIPTGQFIPPVGGAVSSPFQTVTRQDVGLSLRIKPLISEGGTVRVQIFQEVSSVVENTVNSRNGLITNKRSIESTILVDDGQIIVLGGLMQDTVNDGVERIPLVGEIPLVGQLFSYNKRSRNKTNLMVFLRPTLVRDSQGADLLASGQYDRVLEEQKKTKPRYNLVLPEMKPPTLPPRESQVPTPLPPANAFQRSDDGVEAPAPDDTRGPVRMPEALSR